MFLDQDHSQGTPKSWVSFTTDPPPKKDIQRKSPDNPWSFHHPMWSEFWKAEFAWCTLHGADQLPLLAFWALSSSWMTITIRETKSILMGLWYQIYSLHRTLYIVAVYALHTWGLHNAVPWSCTAWNKDNHIQKSCYLLPTHFPNQTLASDHHHTHNFTEWASPHCLSIEYLTLIWFLLKSFDPPRIWTLKPFYFLSHCAWGLSCIYWLNPPKAKIGLPRLAHMWGPALKPKDYSFIQQLPPSTPPC